MRILLIFWRVRLAGVLHLGQLACLTSASIQELWQDWCTYDSSFFSLHMLQGRGMSGSLPSGLFFFGGGSFTEAAAAASARLALTGNKSASHLSSCKRDRRVCLAQASELLEAFSISSQTSSLSWSTAWTFSVLIELLMVDMIL